MNQEQLSTQLVERRASLGISLREVAEQSGVSPSTLSRIEHRTRPADFDNFVKLTNWLGQELSTGAVVVYEPDILAAICRHIRNDPKLDDHGREALCNIMTTAYREFTK